MTTEPTVPENRAMTEYDPKTHALVKQEMPDASEDVQKETMALIEAIKRRAQAEAQGAGELTRDAYLTAVQRAKEAVEQTKLFDKEQIESSMELMLKDAEKNWESIVKEVTSFGDRLADAAKAAWDTLTAPRPDSKP
ncbi:MAG: hypothetical protein Fur006_29190 [Coleofasciculaceae cyanobacterium]|jgi:hypothetical protein